MAVGRMKVHLRLQGGEPAFVEAMSGMVARNLRALKEGKVPRPEQATSVAFVHDDVWQDAPSALLSGRASAGTMAAWIAAAERFRGRPASLVMASGVPGVMVGGNLRRPGDIQWFGPDADAFPRGLVGSLGDAKGRVREWLDLLIDDPLGRPIREIGDGIAIHNAHQIVERNLPLLYESGVVYKVEGAPEQWKDYAEALDDGFDDCEGLGAIRAGEVMARYDLPAMVWTRDVSTAAAQFPGGNPGRGRLFHALTGIVQGDDLVFDDPSVRLGMEVPEWYYQYAAAQRRQGGSMETQPGDPTAARRLLALARGPEATPPNPGILNRASRFIPLV